MNAGRLGGLTLLAACTGPYTEPADPADPCDHLGIVCTVAGTGERGTNGDGHPALASHLNLPTAMAFDAEDRLVIVDFNNQRIRQVEHDGTVRAVAGSGVHSYATPGSPMLDSGLENPIDLAIGPDGTLFIMELHAARVLYTPGGVVEVLVGSAEEPGYEGFTGDGGPGTQATMSQSVGLALDGDLLYFSDTRNHRIRVVDTVTGIVDTVAGDGAPELEDGGPDEASFREPHHLAVHDGHLYVADYGNHALRRVDLADGQVETLAGTGTAGFSGDGGPAAEAQLDEPIGVAVAEDGTIYVADANNHVARRIDPDGTIDTVVGVPGTAGYDGDRGPAAEALLQWPNHLAVHGGDLYVADTQNCAIRRVRGLP